MIDTIVFNSFNLTAWFLEYHLPGSRRGKSNSGKWASSRRMEISRPGEWEYCHADDSSTKNRSECLTHTGIQISLTRFPKPISNGSIAQFLRCSFQCTRSWHRASRPGMRISFHSQIDSAWGINNEDPHPLMAHRCFLKESQVNGRNEKGQRRWDGKNKGTTCALEVKRPTWLATDEAATWIAKIRGRPAKKK